MKKNRPTRNSRLSRMFPEEGGTADLVCFHSSEYFYKELPTFLLESTQPYQRPVDSKHVDALIEQFDQRYLGEIVVSFRGGKYYVLDGQNRIAMVKKMNGDQHCLVKCKVHTGLSYEDEAEMYCYLESGTKKKMFHERVKALVESKRDPAIIEIQKILADAKLTWNFTGSRSGPKMVTASRALIDVYEIYGGLIMSHAIQLLVHTWNGDSRTLSAPFIKGICLFSRAYAQMVTYDSFSKKLRNCTVNEVKMLAQQETALNRQELKFARAFLKLYNRGRQADNRLPDLLEDTYSMMRKSSK